MSGFYDTLETREPATREAVLMAALPRQVAHAKASAPGFAKILADVDVATVTTRAALARLPVTRKSDLKALQQAALPFGGLAVQRAAEDLFELFPSLPCHSLNTLDWLLSSACNQARAALQSLLTVFSVMPIACATSSLLNPTK